LKRFDIIFALVAVALAATWWWKNRRENQR